MRKIIIASIIFLVIVAILGNIEKVPHVERYKLLNGSSFYELENEVERLISLGYQPHGGVAVSGDKYFQVMVK
jgi:hypothetical protein